MEEFKNLKEIIELSEEEINNNNENVSAVLDLVDLKELRNLIARYKELEEKCKKKNKTIETMQFIKAIQRGQENTILMTEEQCAVKNKYMIEVSNGEFVDVNELYHIWKNYIPKSKIKEKIEELKKYKKEISEEKDIFYCEVIGQIRLLQELLD